MVQNFDVWKFLKRHGWENSDEWKVDECHCVYIDRVKDLMDTANTPHIKNAILIIISCDTTTNIGSTLYITDRHAYCAHVALLASYM